MKLAEALLLRADMQKKLASLRERIGKNGVVQEGDRPLEDPHQLLREAQGVLGEMELLIYAINKTNMNQHLPDGRTVTEAIARRDTLIQQHSLLQAAVASTQREPDRYSMREIKWVALLDVSQLQKQSEDVAKKIRELNALIQETNWKVEMD